ncbi:FAD-binding protein [Photobacterium aquae]|uniref:Cryptochrome DASH n=1 Tax=Photobacterium aquae TaxID=1195763 RepID=A0A0J1GVQ0_9GAMM|nr:DASH family cryptochrome [Photobacterium aquae]KLV03711.1 FAD-binding protein [Photobacterium aquae]
MATGIYLFQNDLRLHDNPAFSLACEEVDHLICVYCLPPGNANQYPYRMTQLGYARQQFLLQSLDSLREQLHSYGQVLHVLLEHPLDILPQLISQFSVSAVYSSEHAGIYENRIWQTLQGRYPFLVFRQVAGHTLFDRTELPFDIKELPETFSAFRRQVDDIPIRNPLSSITRMPPAIKSINDYDVVSPMLNSRHDNPFTGGELAGLEHIKHYFASDKPRNYKITRNQLDGWDYSTKFSPWLALGCLSPHTIIRVLENYEHQHGANDSTGWIKFELLWREYFQWYAHCYGTKMYHFAGIRNRRPHTAFYPERFRRWCEGNTPYPIVNACMNQLRQTGFMSNRGRQLVASCLVNELELDWRYGAGYFEQHLIDYDLASNWGNWQYLAGVGADPREHRRFNLDKQTAQYDPEQRFIRSWQGNKHDGGMDSVDAADWPIY